MLQILVYEFKIIVWNFGSFFCYVECFSFVVKFVNHVFSMMMKLRLFLHDDLYAVKVARFAKMGLLLHFQSLRLLWNIFFFCLSGEFFCIISIINFFTNNFMNYDRIFSIKYVRHWTHHNIWRVIFQTVSVTEFFHYYCHSSVFPS